MVQESWSDRHMVKATHNIYMIATSKLVMSCIISEQLGYGAFVVVASVVVADGSSRRMTQGRKG